MNRLVIIGGGASGIFCAVNVARICKDLEVVVLEKSSKLLSKVKVSGGGRCNVTHFADEISELLDAYPRGKHFMRKTLHVFSNKHTEEWFEERGVSLKVEEDGRMFPKTDNSQTIIDCLLEEAAKYKVQIITNAAVKSIGKIDNNFTIEFEKNGSGTQINCLYVAVATGGSPKAEGFTWLAPLGIEFDNPVPSLFTFNIQEKELHALMGLAATDALVKIPVLKIQEQGPVLITHWGLSGPAVLKLSSKAAVELNGLDYNFELKMNWFAGQHESSMLESFKKYRISFSKTLISNKNPLGLPSRLWVYLLNRSGIDHFKNWSDVSTVLINRLSRTISNDSYIVSGKTTFKEEFVTAGGIKLSQIDPATMESKVVPGMYFMGEVMNVDGITGGYNFQHAWSSGWIAANAIGNRQ